ncbi:MAG: hypothetical protein A2W17_04445 [Planctomycetes bacterium RBG_16_41_13]|nr:MAG: hypothetical protein A2W17_04445 [Planctomycetes bacterium RBG_16_41_13]
MFKKLNDLRKGYPVHGDNLESIVPAHDYFGIPYPVSDNELAWEKILSKYFYAMREILKIFINARGKG